MNIHLNGFNQQAVTLIAGEGVEPGSPVAIANEENNTVVGVLSESAGDFIGICLNCRGGRAAVQLQGYVELETDGSAFNLGWNGISFNEEGKAQPGGGHEFLVLNSNPESCRVGIVL